MVRCLLALGSNVGNREAQLRAGLAGLAEHGVRPIRGASLYSTEPKELLSQPWFLNTVVEVETALEPEELMRVCQAVEQSRNRERSVPKGPRTLDIDIILYGDRVVGTDDLKIPHPRYTARRFVLEPLAEIAFDAIDPVTGKTVGVLLAEVSDESGVDRVGAPIV
jgi:2-amino-4-hydroxy-6-hydroxymethyldihydropteridine diphosphokinase